MENNNKFNDKLKQQELRIECIKLALGQEMALSGSKPTADRVIASAKKFYAFVKIS